jgi:hypothetical protein
MQSGVAVEEVQFPPKQPKFGRYNMPRKFRKSFVGHPGANLFLTISLGGVFQPRDVSTVARDLREPSGSTE